MNKKSESDAIWCFLGGRARKNGKDHEYEKIKESVFWWFFSAYQNTDYISFDKRVDFPGNLIPVYSVATDTDNQNNGYSIRCIKE